MKFNKIIVLSSIMLLLFLTVGMSAANENVTVDEGMPDDGLIGINEEISEKISIDNSDYLFTENNKTNTLFNYKNEVIINQTLEIHLIDENGNSIPNANVEVIKDYFFQYNKTTDKNGIFCMVPQKGSYLIQYWGNEIYNPTYSIFTGIEGDMSKELVTITAVYYDEFPNVFYGDYELFVVEDQYGDTIYDVKLILTWSDNTTDVVYTDEYDEYDEDFNYCEYYFYKKLGKYSVTVTLDDKDYYAKPLTLNYTITQAPVQLTLNKYYTTDKEYAILKAIVKDQYGYYVDEGYVKFTIDGKSYTVEVKNGIATKKIKLSKSKTYTYKATFTSENYKTKTASQKIYVYSTSKNARTFNVKGYKVTLSQNQYKSLINAKNTGKTVRYVLKTNKKVKQTITYDYKNYKTIKAPVYVAISYGGKEPKRQEQYPNKYTIFVETKYTPDVTKGKLILTKRASTISELKKAKVTDMSHFSMR